MRTIRSGRYRSRGLPSALVILSLLGPLSVAGGQVQLDGEHGLWVTDSGGEMGVGWLLSRSDVGVLEVFSEGRSVYRVETPLGQAHFTTFPRPSGATVLLRYGALEAEDFYSTVLYLRGEAPRALEVLAGVDSLYVVGDVQGEYDRLLGLRGNAGLIDTEDHWVGGGSHVVFLGDVFDRGADVTRTLWFLYELER